MPRKQFAEIKQIMNQTQPKQKQKQGAGGPKRFLDFQTTITTNQQNSGTQQYGAGQSLNTGKGRKNMVIGGNTSPLSKREIIASVYSTTSFQALQFTIQPANETSFPWIFDVAKKFQKWRVKRLKYIYVPSVDSFSEAGKQGRIVIAANYDPLDPPMANLVAAVDIKPSQAGVPSKGLELTLDPRMCTPEPLLTRPGQVPAGGTIVSYDAGSVYFCTEGFASTDGTKIGELYVDYEFEFFNSIIPGTTMVPTATHSALFYAAYDVVTVITPSTWSMLPGLSIAANGWNGLGIEVDEATGTLTLPPGRYHISGKIVVDATTVTVMYTRFTVNGVVAPCSQTTSSGGGLAAAGTYWDLTIKKDETFTVKPEIFIGGTGTITPTNAQWPTITIETI